MPAEARFCRALLVILESGLYLGELIMRFKEMSDTLMCAFQEDFSGDCVRLDYSPKRLCFSDSGSVGLGEKGHFLREV